MCKPDGLGCELSLLEQMQVILPHVFPREVSPFLSPFLTKACVAFNYTSEGALVAAYRSRT